MSPPRSADFQVEGRSLSWDAQDRARDLEAATRRDFPLIIIGGGITGAGLAREAALRHIPFLLVDQDDFAAGTSSRSSKLVHGGLRYLAQGDFRLVREATTERNWLRSALPNLVRPLAFHWCAYRGGRDRPARIRWGIRLYELLSNSFSRYPNAHPHQFLDPAGLAEREPAVDRTGLLMAGLFYDTTVDDARLTLETLKEARDLSGGRSLALNYVRAEHILMESGRVSGVDLEDRIGGQRFQVRTGCVVNATGVWADATLGRAGQESRLIRPTKGVHLVVPNARLGNRGGFALRSPDDGRSFFVLRRGDVSLIGTTDTDYAGSLEQPRCQREDCDYLLRAVNRMFPQARLGYEDILSTYAGLRPLIQAPGPSASSLSRRHLIQDPGTGLVTVAGGKLTTFRTMAWEVLARCARGGYLRPLRGAEASRGFSRRPYKVGLDWDRFLALLEPLDLAGLLAEPMLRHLQQQYGHAALAILGRIKASPGCGQPLLAGQPFCAAEIQHILAFENAPSLMDVMLRRTEMQMTVAHRLQPELAAQVAALMACHYRWDPDRTRAERDRYLGHCQASITF